MKRSIIFMFLLSVIISASKGQEVSVTTAFDTSRIFIGDQINFTVTVDQPSEVSVTLPFFKDSLCKNIEILAGPIVDSSLSQDGRIKILEKYLITSFDSGFYQIPPVFAEMKSENGLKRFYSDYSQLEVIRVSITPVDTTAKIFDIIEPYRAPVTIGEILPWLLLLILCGIIIYAIVKYLPRLKRVKTGIEKIIDPDPAHVIAFRELEKLKEDQLWQKGEIKNYYTRLTEILRLYLEKRFNVFSLELTTNETLDALIKTGFKKQDSYHILRSVLVGADLIKFAKYNPEPAENEEHFQNSWNFVEATKEKEVIMAVANENDKAGEEEK